MGYKTYTEVVADHIAFLHSQGLVVEELQVDAGFIRCREIGHTRGRGELSYKATSTKMENGLMGLATWCRGINGMKNFQSYGISKILNEDIAEIKIPEMRELPRDEKHEEAAKKAYGFWKNSQTTGTSDYLDRKGVGSHYIRFRNSEEYGRVAVIPMFDENNRLWSYQLLNPDGTKRHPKDARTEGLFHCLASLVDGLPLGIAESYVTAATCFELTGIPTVCAFGCHNLTAIAKILRLKLPNSPIVLFADNDRHLPSNQGVLKAQEACNAIEGKKTLAIPDFGAIDPFKEASDWNDLFRLQGGEIARTQIKNLLTNLGHDKRSDQ